MMKLDDLTISNSGETVTLYRGDSTKIDAFRFIPTEQDVSLFMPLFGPGVYLTDNAKAALDYTLKNSDDTLLFRTSPDGPAVKSLTDALNAYLDELVREQREKTEQEFRQHWSEALWDALAGLERGTEEYERTNKEMLNRFEAASKQRLLDFRRKTFDEKILPVMEQLKVIRTTQGEYSIVLNSHAGYVSVFEISKSVLDHTLNAETSLPEKIFSKIVPLIRGNGKRSPLFLGRYGLGSEFDDWLKAYRTTGVRVAWSDGKMMGGSRSNPSLDDLLNHTSWGIETHHGF